MIHPDTELRRISDEVGYGVVATRPIPRGTLVWTLCAFDRVFSPAQAASLPPAYHGILGKYAYIDPASNYVLCWDAGRYVNHSCDPAMLSVGNDFDVLVRDIQPGEQITCEYGGLNLTGRLDCHCGAPNCRGTISGSDVLEQWRSWDTSIASVLKSAANVPQPLLAFALDATRFTDYVDGKRPVPSHLDFYVGPAHGADFRKGSAPWALAHRVRRVG